MFVNRIGTLVLPFLTLYTTQEIGWTKIQAGVAVSWFGIGSLAGSYLGGWLTDRIGYYRVFMYSLVIGGLAFFSLQYLTGYVELCIGLFLASTMADMLRPALYTGVRFITDDSNRTRAISLLRMAFNLGIAVGPALGGLLIAITDYSWIFIIDAVTCWAAAVMAYRWISDHSHKQFEQPTDKSEVYTESPYRDVPFMIFMVFNLIMLIGFFQILFTVPLYLDEVLGFGTAAVGVFFAVNGGMIFIFEMPIVHWVEQRWSAMPAMILGAVMMGAAMIFLLIPYPIWVPLVFYMLLASYGEIINFPFISTTALKRATDSNSGTMMALTSVVFSLALILAPIIGTYLIASYGYDILWIVMSSACILSGLGIYTIKHHFS